jgi:hypothetical protein
MRATIVALLVCPLLGSLAQAQAPSAIQDVKWLQGCWHDSTADRTVQESWMPPLGDNMVGVSRTVAKNARLREFEVMAIRQTATGLVFEARPSGQPAAAFPASSGGPTSIVFENAAHDFPQRIGYEKRDDGTLLAWIEGPRAGKVQRIEFRYAHAACP